jgi:nucleoid-associated protein YgaU
MMKDPAVKIALAFCVLLTGVFSAMLFRRDSTRPTSPGPAPSEQLLIRHRAIAPAPATRSKAADRPASDERPAAVVTPLDRREPPPPLAQDYPGTDRPASSRWGASMSMMLPASASTEDLARTHRIVDGDTLASLAERFLGATSRAGEIFEKNRDVLLDPNLLPIGVELKIPPRAGRPAAASAPSSATPAKPPLTPIPKGGR